MLLRLFIQELHNIMTISQGQCGLKEEIDAENNIIIGDLTLSNILPPRLNNMTDWYKVMCGCECCIFTKCMNSSLLTWRGCHLKHLKDRSHNAQNRSSGGISGPSFETHINAVQPCVCHIYNNTADIDMTTMCPWTSKHHWLPHFKCVIHCCK